MRLRRRTDFKNSVFFILFILGQQQNFNLLLKLRHFFLEVIIFGLGHFAHFLVQLGVIHH